MRTARATVLGCKNFEPSYSPPSCATISRCWDIAVSSLLMNTWYSTIWLLPSPLRAAFAKRFKSLVGETVFQYLTSLRMQKAQQLLRETALPVYEVAQRAGYESDLAFTRAFKKMTSRTPRQFRLQEQV